MAFLLLATAIVTFALGLIWVALHVDDSSGLSLTLKKLICRIFLIYFRFKNRNIFKYTTKTKHLRKTGICPTEKEWFSENPRQLIDNPQAGDSIEFWGIDHRGNALTVHITRRHDRSAEIWIYLKLQSGDEYTSSIHPHTYVYNVNEKTFSTKGLTLEVLEPLRRWRIIFKGLMRKGNCYDVNQGPEEQVEVRFNLIWSPSYLLYVLKRDFNIKSTVETISSLKWSPFFLHLLDISPDERYEQWGGFRGTLQINAEEKILKLRGPKIRSHGLKDWKTVNKRLRLYLHVEDGAIISLQSDDTSEGLKNLTHGYTIPPSNFELNAISKNDLNLTDIFNDESNQLNLNFTANCKKYNVNIEMQKEGCRIFGGRSWDCEITTRLINCLVNGQPAVGFIEFSKPYLGQCYIPTEVSLPQLKETDDYNHYCNSLKLVDPKCRNSNVVGGKGASLALMTTVKDVGEKFEVPDGICLTRNAFSSHINQNVDIYRAIKELENCAWGIQEGSVNSLCQNVVNAITSSDVPLDVKTDVKNRLIEVFGDDVEEILLAVRSSAIGEDGEEMSAAGQNETVLGVKGFPNIFESVLKCWASQFAFRSVEYKRQHGQLLNGGMGVVIQKMIPSEVAGVMFTLDPTSGSFGFVTITANYGLGESVVSALSDPDTITLKRGINDEVSVLKKDIGKKKVKIILKNEGGTEEQDVDLSSSEECTLSDELALKLGRIAVYLDNSYGSPRDIEWAISNGKIFLLQCRPVTTHLQVEQQEILHEFDTPLNTDNEFLTRANVGEVMPGALSPLTLSTLRRSWSILDVYFTALHVDNFPYNPFSPLPFSMASYCNHFLMDRVGQKMFSLSDKPHPMNYAFHLALHGRIIDDVDVQSTALKRFALPSFKTKIRGTYNTFIGNLLLAKRSLDISKKKFGNYEIQTADVKTAHDLYKKIEEHFLDVCEICYTHIKVSSGSMFWNLIVLQTLAGTFTDLTLDHYNDFATLIGQGVGAISGDVPSRLKRLARTIKQQNSKDFCAMTSENALSWLQSGSEESCRQFREFIKTHGHRGFKEYELSAIPLRMDTIKLVEALKAMVMSLTPDECKEEKLTSQQIIDGLKTKLSKPQRWMLSFLLPRCQNAVVNREAAKTMMIKVVDCLRMAYLKLGEMLMKEGKLINPRLIFFFTHEEIKMLLTSRSPRIIGRAIYRQRYFQYMDSLHFHEFINGEIKAIEEEEIDDSMRSNEDSNVVKITGSPVCQGFVKGPARVILKFADINQLKQGDILITYGTDIAWTPYFPMLAGVVTELGGLVSHGAVIAREYGLPCLVAAQGATKIFKSGDYVLLNASKGTLEKIAN